MFSRRSFLAGGFFAPRSSSTSSDDAQLLTEIRDELRALRATCELPHCGEIDQVRAQQRTFLRGRQKLPDFMDLGVDVWERVYEWLITTRQRADIVRLADGRYALQFLTTMLVLRPDASAGFVGFGYDR